MQKEIQPKYCSQTFNNIISYDMNLPNIERHVGLHYFLEVNYYVDHYEAAIVSEVNDYKVHTAEGETLAKAIEALELKLQS